MIALGFYLGFGLVLVALPVPDPNQKQLAETVSAYLLEPDYPKFVKTIEEWKKLPLRDRARMVGLLVKHVGSTEKPGVTNPADLIIPYRFKTKDLKPYGHGHVVLQDLFIVGGKAAWAIEQLTGVDTWLPEINEGQAKKERAEQVQVIGRYVVLFEQVASYLAEPDYPTVLGTVETWKALSAEDRIRVMELLAAHLRSTVKPGLKNHLNNIKVHYRVETGEMPRGNFKRFTYQDLYIYGGKAAWAINDLIEPRPMELPEITEGQTDEERAGQARTITLCVAAYRSGVKQAMTSVRPKK